MDTRISRDTSNSKNALNSRKASNSRTACNSMLERNSRNTNNTIGYTVQGEPNLESCESDISLKTYSRLTIPPPPPPPSHMPKNKAIQLYRNMTHGMRVNTHKGEYR
jgi:hypothetical protein